MTLDEEIRGADPETLGATRRFNEWLEERLAGEPSLLEIGPFEARRRRRAGEAVFPPPPVFLPQARDLEIEARGGALRMRVLAPEGDPAGVYMHIHGGGWVLGAADLQDPLLWGLVRATGLCAVSVDYRLAPEHPFPAAVEDCEDAARWILEHGREALGAPPRFAIGGESAGGHLSVLTLLLLREHPSPAGAFAAANLVYGAYDLSLTPSQRLWGERNLVLSTPIIEYFLDQFVPRLDREAVRSARLSPLFADLHDLPSALFTVGTLDPLVDDTLFMSRRWAAAGNKARLRVWPEAVHGFVSLPIAAADEARAEQYAFLNEAVAAPTSTPSVAENR